jgi:protein subunit release factor B
MSAFPPEYLRAHLEALGCDIGRVEESFIHSGGHGGQNVNKVSTCVQLRYAPRNILLKMQEHRTQAANRIAAWKLLATQLQRMRDAAKMARQAERERKRRQNAQRPRGVKRQFVEGKRHRAKIRNERKSQGGED